MSSTEPRSPGVADATSDQKRLERVQASWEQQCSKLSAEERGLFVSHACGSLQDYLESIQNACQRNKDQNVGLKAIEWFEPIFKAVELFTPSLALGVQAYPNPGSLVLGGISAVVHTFSRLTSYLKLTLRLLDEMARKVSVLLRYGKEIYKDDSELQDGIVKVYGDILSFCKKAFRFKKKNGETLARIRGMALVIFSDFETHFDQELHDFRDHMSQVESLALLRDKQRLEGLCRAQESQRKDTAQIAQQTRDYVQSNKRHDQLIALLSNREEEMRELKERQERDQVKVKSLAWLSSLDFEEPYLQKCREQLPGTGQWLLDAKAFNEWKDSQGSTLLWVRGKPGCGKSVLAAVAISSLHLEVCEDIACVYAFCQRDNEAFQEAPNILASLARQLSEQFAGPSPELESAYKSSQHGARPSLRESIAIMKAAASRFSKVYVVIDALDECRENREIASEITSFIQYHSGSQIKVMALSRSDFGLDSIFSNCKLIQPESGANEKDIQTYIRSMFGGSSEKVTSQKIVDECIHKADGTFLWVKLLKQDFDSTPMTLRQQLKSIQDIPGGLEDTYNRMIDQMRSQKDSVRLIATQVLTWVIHARRPLRKREMLNAVADYDGITTVEEASDSKYSSAEHLVMICKNLVFIDKDKRFRLCHESARDTVINHLRKAYDEGGEVASSSNDGASTKANEYLAGTCLKFLLLTTFERGPARTMNGFRALTRRYPFLDYAGRYWASHLPHKTEITPSLRNQVFELLDSAPRRELSLQITSRGSSAIKALWNRRNSSNPLHLVSFLGLRTIAESFADDIQLTQEADGMGVTPLAYASLGGHQEMTLWLVKRLTTVVGLRLDSDQKQIALHQAVSLGWTNVLDVLVSKEEPVLDSVIDEGGTPLTKACSTNSLEAAKLLVNCNADLNKKDGKGNSPLHIAVVNRRTEILKLLLEHGANIESTNDDGHTPLHTAAIYDSVDASEILIKRGADIEARDTTVNECTPLHYAASKQSLDVIRVLQRAGANMDAKSALERTALHWTAKFDHYKAAKLLLKLSNSKDDVDSLDRTPLLAAALEGSLETVKVLVNGRCTLQGRDSNGRNLTYCAASSRKFDVTQYILGQLPPEERKLAVNEQANNGETSLHRAVQADDLKMVKLLLDAGARADIVDSYGHCALHDAALGGRKTLCFALLESTRDPNPVNNIGETPLHVAARFGSIAFMKQFFEDCSQLELTVHVDAQNETKDTALMTALFRAFEEGAELLLEKNAASTINSSNNYPIHLAAWFGFDRIIEKLLDHPGVVSKGYYGRTPLYCAALRGHLSSVKLLIKKADDMLNIAENDGMTPVMGALAGRHLDIANFLLGCDANCMCVDSTGRGMIHWATTHGDDAMVQRLLDLGCDGSAPDKDGDTPCYYAVSTTNIEVVEILVAGGFNTINRPNLVGTTCACYAAKGSDRRLLEVLHRHGADFESKDVLGKCATIYAAESGQRDILEYLVDECGARLDVTDLFGTTPLITAAARGFSETVKYIIGRTRANVNAYTVARESALTVAAICGFPLTIRALLAGGANPYHRDLSGRNTLDHAAQHSSSFAEFERAEIVYEATTFQELESTLNQTIVECCKALLDSPFGRLDGAEFHQRCERQQILANALFRLQDYENARICFRDNYLSRKLYVTTGSYSCDICGQEKSEGKVFLCHSCPISSERGRFDLCEQCHDDYVKAGRRAPDAFLKSRQLEREIHDIRFALPELLPLLSITAILCYFETGQDWLSRMSDAYQKWDGKYDVSGKWNGLDRPGQEFISLVSKTRSLLPRISRGDSISAMEVKNLKDRTLDYTKLKRQHRADEEMRPFRCEGHEFCMVPPETPYLSKPDESDADLRSGLITEEFLENLLIKYGSNIYKAGVEALPDSDSEASELRSNPTSQSQVMHEDSQSKHLRTEDTSQNGVARLNKGTHEEARSGALLEHETQPMDIKFSRKMRTPSKQTRVEVWKTGILAAVQAQVEGSITNPSENLAISRSPWGPEKRSVTFSIEDALESLSSNDLSLPENSQVSQSDNPVPNSVSTGVSVDGMQLTGNANDEARLTGNGSDSEAKRPAVYISYDDDDEDMQMWFQALLVTEKMKPGFVREYLAKCVQEEADEEDDEELGYDNEDAASSSQSESSSDEGDSDEDLLRANG